MDKKLIIAIVAAVICCCCLCCLCCSSILGCGGLYYQQSKTKDKSTKKTSSKSTPGKTASTPSSSGKAASSGKTAPTPSSSGKAAPTPSSSGKSSSTKETDKSISNFSFNGECTDGFERLIYENSSDNPGTRIEQRKRCEEACKDSEIYKGYIVYDASTGSHTDNTAANGRCFCESSDSSTCTKDENTGYVRYDYESIPSKGFKFFGECSDGTEEIKFENADENSGHPYQQQVKCKKACKDSTGYIVYDAVTGSDIDNTVTDGRCFCESSDSSTCTKLENNGYVRYDN